MDLIKSLNKLGKSEIIIKSHLWNSIITVFRDEKNIEMSEYLVSITIKKDTIIVKTNNPTINSEAYIYLDQITDDFSDKLEKMWLKDVEFTLKFV